MKKATLSLAMFMLAFSTYGAVSGNQGHGRDLIGRHPTQPRQVVPCDEIAPGVRCVAL